MRSETNLQSLSDKYIIDIYNKKLYETYSKYKLISIEENHYHYKSLNLFDVPFKQHNPERKFNSTKNLWDIVNCSNDLKYFTGQLYFLRPYINNPLKEVYDINNKKVSHYFQNVYDRRYSIYVTCCFEKSYNFWDRIGDLIASFHSDLSEYEITFPKVIDELKKKKFSGIHFDWLIKFKDNHYTDLNQYRRDFVHYFQYESDYRYNQTINCSNTESLEKLWKEKFGFPEYFKNHLELMSEGCYQTYKLLGK